MAERPVFIPLEPEDTTLVQERCFPFRWHPGFAAVQKKRNVEALHASAAASGVGPLLEVSTKSDVPLGRRLSAFNLRIETRRRGRIPLESAYQGSKVFERGGPFEDLYERGAWEAKKDERLRASGDLIRFQFDGMRFGAEPKRAFYDWLYLKALFPLRDDLHELSRYRGFTDIEFNPRKSFNCQAHACAMYVALERRGQLNAEVLRPDRFVELFGEAPNIVSSLRRAPGSLFA